MKRTLILSLCVFFLVGCGEMEKKETPLLTEPIKITSEEMKDLFAENDYIIIDVREDYEYNKEHVLGAINVSVKNIETIVETIPKNKNIIVYCRSGNRSNTAALKLIELGYTKVYDLGGIDSINLDKISEEV